ncbi:unnamed protein product [Rotaria sp. Silwood2]|nr:unnamed protein product [Rotaria sp. Silwood2]CAF4018610.1 unnamed protein product [Rotaria sp. Silwood2]
MDSIDIQWQKQSSGDIYTLSSGQYLQQPSILKLDNQEIKPKKKKVQFKFRTSTPKTQAFENTQHNHSKIFEDHDYTSSSTNILNDELLETYGKQTSSTRSKILTIIIVLFIIITVGIVVGIVVGVTKSKQSISETTTINNQTSLSTTTLVSSISIGNQSGPPCSSYTTINDPSRNVAQTSYGFCDNGAPFNTNNGGSWIRFIGTGGTMIPLTPPGLNHCGGYVGGWFNDTLPTTVGTVVNGTVCFTMNENSCPFQISVFVINCSGGFYVYFLPPTPVCNARYCTT